MARKSSSSERNENERRNSRLLAESGISRRQMDRSMSREEKKEMRKIVKEMEKKRSPQTLVARLTDKDKRFIAKRRKALRTGEEKPLIPVRTIE